MMTQMKKSAIALAVASAFWGATAVADNNDTADATVSGEVIAALSVADGSAMVLPTLVVPDTGEPNTSIALTCAQADGSPSVAYSGEGNPFAGDGGKTETGLGTNSANVSATLGSQGVCADFAVTGQGVYHYTVVPSVKTNFADAKLTLSVDATTSCITKSDGSSTKGTLAAGADNIYCGAIITAEIGAAVKDHTDGAITVAVVYD